MLNNVETYANVPNIILTGRGLVQVHRHRRQSTGYEGLRPHRRNDEQHRPDRSSHGYDPAQNSSTTSAAAFQRRRGIQGRADRRPVRRLPDRRTSGRASGLRLPSRKIGAIIGSGGMVVMDEDTCMVEVARFFMELHPAANPAASAPPAGKAPSGCWKFSSEDRRRSRARWRTSTRWKNSPRR